MIREFHPEDLPSLMSIWLDSNSQAHPFIPLSTWQSLRSQVQEQLPSSTLFVCQQQDQVVGFIGIVEDGYIAGLFVDRHYQSQGVGRRLIEYCKQRYSRLELDVFVQNPRAVAFYQKNEFSIEGEKSNLDFLLPEYRMVWLR